MTELPGTYPHSSTLDLCKVLEAVRTAHRQRALTLVPTFKSDSRRNVMI